MEVRLGLSKERGKGMSNGITKGLAIVDNWGNLHRLDKNAIMKGSGRLANAFVEELGLVVNAFAVEANRDAWDQAKALMESDRKTEAWQVILTEGRVL